MRKISVFLPVAIVVLTLACSERQQIPEGFVGTWQSDEALTLASLDKSKSITPADREMFSDDFFGKRVVVYRSHEGKTYWIGEEWGGVEQDAKWYPYDFAASGPDFITFRTPPGETSWHLDGDYIYAKPSEWDFREYYRRIDD